MGIVLSEHCTVYIQATSLLQKLWNRVSQVSEHMWKTLNRFWLVKIGLHFRPFVYLFNVNCGQMSFIVWLLSRFMAWEIHRTLHNFLPCLTFMLFRICNTKNYLFMQITVISVVLRTILRQQTLLFIQNICQTEKLSKILHTIWFS